MVQSKQYLKHFKFLEGKITDQNILYIVLYQNTFITRCLNKFTFVPADSGYALIRRKARILQVLSRPVSTPSENTKKIGMRSSAQNPMSNDDNTIAVARC